MLNTCSACSTGFAVDLDACPHCGSTEYEREGVAVSRRLPAFASVSCDCGRGPWNIRLSGPLPGLIALPSLFCASCGSQVQVPWPPVEDSMSPKITAHGGATNAREAESSPDAVASPPLAGAEADQGHPTSEPEAVAVAEPGETAEEASVTVPVDRYDEMTIGDLRSEVAARSLGARGTRPQIIARLREADAASQ